MRRRSFIAVAGALFAYSAVAFGQSNSPLTLIATNGITVQLVQPTPQPAGAWVPTFQNSAPYVAAAFAVLAAIIALRRGRVDARYAYASEMLKFRLRQIDTFYAPVLLHLEQSTIVYKKLLWTIKQERSDISLDGFRLLDYILEFQSDERFKPLVKRILTIGEQMTAMISQHAGLIEGGITPIFTEYQAHFEILRAASEQQLSKKHQEGWHEVGYFPRMLIREIREGYKIVLAHLDNYVCAGDKIIYGLLGRKNIDIGQYRQQLLDNLYYYEQHASSYAAKYDKFNLESIRQRFINAIDKTQKDRPSELDDLGITVLDAGCGTGRDTYEFLKQGYHVTAVDPSPAMLRECQKKLRNAQEKPVSDLMKKAALKSRYFELTIDEMTFKNEFDGVWAAASLLHVPTQSMEDNLRKLFKTLKLNGIMYLSFKHGEGDTIHDARLFSYFNRRSIRKLFSAFPEADEIEVWLSDSEGREISRVAECFAWSLEWIHRYDRRRWLNVLVRRNRL